MRCVAIRFQLGVVTCLRKLRCLPVTLRPGVAYRAHNDFPTSHAFDSCLPSRIDTSFSSLGMRRHKSRALALRSSGRRKEGELWL